MGFSSIRVACSTKRRTSGTKYYINYSKEKTNGYERLLKPFAMLAARSKAETSLASRGNGENSRVSDVYG